MLAGPAPPRPEEPNWRSRSNAHCMRSLEQDGKSAQGSLRGTVVTHLGQASPDPRSAPRDELLTVAQAGEYLGTGERFIRRLVAQRRITYVKLGKYVRLQRSVLDAFIEAGQVPSE